jgi:hypothetical protein
VEGNKWIKSILFICRKCFDGSVIGLIFYSGPDLGWRMLLMTSVYSDYHSGVAAQVTKTIGSKVEHSK